MTAQSQQDNKHQSKSKLVEHIHNTGRQNRGTINPVRWEVFHVIHKGLPYLQRFYSYSSTSKFIFWRSIELFILESPFPNGRGTSNFQFNVKHFFARSAKFLRLTAWLFMRLELVKLPSAQRGRYLGVYMG